MTTRAVQGALVAAVQFTPPSVDSLVVQGAIVLAVRLYPRIRQVEINPAVDLPCIASCGSVPHFWRET